MRKLVLVLLAFSALLAEAAFTVSQRRILRDGSPFFVQGVCYQPTPIGNNNVVDGTHGDYYTAGYAALQERDLPLLRAMGANVLRVYGWNVAASHTAFLDRCYNGGSQPLFVLVNYWIDPATDWTNVAAVNAIAQQYVAIENNLANHPAVLGLIIGNEVNSQNGNGAKPAFWAAMNTIAQAINAANPSRLVSIAITDALADVQAFDVAVPAVDFWSLQIYRHPTFGTFFADYAARSSRPLLVSEFGLDAYDHANSQAYPDNAAFVGERLASLWGEIFDAAAGPSAVCSGACVFEYSDEWYKAPGEEWLRWTHESGGYAAPWLPDGWGDEEWWGLFAVSFNGAAPNIITPRAGVARLTALWTAPPLRVVVQPQDLLVRLGTTAQLRFETVSPLATTCEWRRDGTLLSGGADGLLLFSPVSWTDTGHFQAKAVTAGGAVLSNTVRVVVHNDTYTSYAGWAAAAFSAAELAEPAISGVIADPDGAGVPNLLRYAFKRAPLRGALSTALVVMTTAVENGATYAEVGFTRKTYDPRLTYFVETSTDLVTWSVFQTLVAAYPGPQLIRYGTPLSADARRFFRVRVVLAP